MKTLILLSITLTLNLFCVDVQAQNGWTSFEKDGKWGYRDGKGRIVLPPRFIVANDFSPEGIAAVLDEKGWAYIDKKGNILIRPFMVDNGPDYFQEGLARFTVDDRFGFFNEKGQVVIKPQFDFAQPFREGLAAICMGCKQRAEGEHAIVEGGKWGYINRKGEIAISLQFESAGPFKNGKAKVRLKGKPMVINKNGEIIGDNSEKKPARMELIDQGHIVMGGGCEVYHSGKIVFIPKEESIEVRLENSGGYFAPKQKFDQPIQDFEVLLTAERITPFFTQLSYFINHPPNRRTYSTIKAKLEIFLPLKTGKLDVKLSETEGTLPFDEPIIQEIKKFVTDCLRKPRRTP